MTAVVRIATLLLVFAAITPKVHAMGNAPCDSARVFDGAAVNVVVLPYAYTAPPQMAERDIGEKLTALIQGEVLYSILRFQSIGVVRLYGDPEDCSPDRVLPRLITPPSVDWGAFFQNPPASLKGPGRSALVVLWGTIYQEGENLYVQTFLRFRRRDSNDPGENVFLKLGGAYLGGRLSSQAFAFPPRRLTVQDLSRISEAYAKNAVLRAEKNDNATVTWELKTPMTQSWTVTGQDGDWVHLSAYSIADRGLLKDGWLHAGASLGATPLSTTLPELHFVEGLVGYLRHRVAGANRAMDTAALAALQAARAPADVESADTTAEAVGRQLEGFLSLLEEGETKDAVQTAHARFQEAAQLIPYSADAGSLELLTKMLAAWYSPATPLSQKQFAAETWRLCGLEPGNRDVLRNLVAFYYFSIQQSVRPRIAESERLDQTSVQKIEALNLQFQSPTVADSAPKGDWILRGTV